MGEVDGWGRWMDDIQHRPTGLDEGGEIDEVERSKKFIEHLIYIRNYIMCLGYSCVKVKLGPCFHNCSSIALFVFLDNLLNS